MSLFLKDSTEVPEEAIYIDNSLLFGSLSICEERARLSRIRSLKPRVQNLALDFGSAIHAGIAALGNNNNDIEKAHSEFILTLQKQATIMPIDIMDAEKHSVERGLNLISAYQERWKGDFYETLKSDDGKPFTEVRFRIYLFDWHGVPVIFCGLVDRVAVSLISQRIVNIETKTSGTALSQHALQVRPNHQITGYIVAIRELLGLDVSETLWDAIFKSNRKPDPKGGLWGSKGIDIQKDFLRTSTSRSERDIKEWHFDVREAAVKFLKLRDSNKERWTRTNNPMACHIYGGCAFQRICATNLDEAVIKSDFIVQPWQPWLEEDT
jgi:hypothetical protein